MPINAENLLDYSFSNLVDSSLLAALAQLVEQRTENPCVPGSIPGGGNPTKMVTPCKSRSYFISRAPENPSCTANVPQFLLFSVHFKGGFYGTL